MNKTVLTNSDGSKIIVHAQWLFSHREIAICKVNLDNTLAAEVRLAILEYHKDSTTWIEREVFGVFGCVRGWRYKT